MKQTFQRVALGIAALGFALVLIYILLGHGLIRAMYESDLSILSQIMEGKAVTPLQAYFAAADLVVSKARLGFGPCGRTVVGYFQESGGHYFFRHVVFDRFVRCFFAPRPVSRARQATALGHHSLFQLPADLRS